jgi:adenylosuccinate synthase
MKLNIDVVVGCSFGDEGKGKVVYDLLKNSPYQLCVRFNGSGNAGHTIYENGNKLVVHQLPVGTLIPNMYNLISSDCLIDMVRLKEEIKYLNEKNIDIQNRLFISRACHLITPDAIDYDRNNNKIGTTGSGIGPTYAKKMLRTGDRIEAYESELEKMGIKLVSMRKFWNQEFLSQYNIQNVLMEGAQGFELDINWTNNYPYCTSSTCTIAGAINTGINIRDIKRVYGISKIYDTYVGTMEFQPAQYEEELNLIADTGNEYGSTTGRRRQCNYLNIVNLKEALKYNSCTICIINKVDILEKLNIFKLYDENHNLRIFNTLDEMKVYISKSLNGIVQQVIYSSSLNKI